MSRYRIKKILKELLIGVLILFVVSNLLSYLRKPTLNSEGLPPIVKSAIAKSGIDLSAYRGEPLMIHFWATWCPVCKMEIDNIQRVSQHYRVITIAVNSGSQSDITTFLKEKNLNLLLINDRNSSIAKSMQVEFFPTTFIYDKDGKLFSSQIGYTTTLGLLVRMLWAGM